MVNMLQGPPGSGKTTFMWARECAATDTIDDTGIVFERAVPALRVDILAQQTFGKEDEGEVYI